MKSYKTQIPFFLFCYFFCFTSVSISAGIFLNNFLELYATLSGKFLVANFPFLTDSPQSPAPPSLWPNLRDKSFLSIFPKMSSEIYIFFQIFV